MAEVTINIESSLAAMAFVVADQQDTIKALRAVNAEEHKVSKQYHDELCEMQQKYDDACNRLEQQEELHSAELAEKDAQLKNAEDDFSGMVAQRDRLTEELERTKRAYINDFHWEPWPEGKECITIPFDDLREKDCFPYAFVMYDLQEADVPLSPTEEQYKVRSPWIHCYMLNANENKRIASIYADCNMKPRMFALVYPKDLITEEAMAKFYSYGGPKIL